MQTREKVERMQRMIEVKRRECTASETETREQETFDRGQAKEPPHNIAARILEKSKQENVV